jgi:translation initiation factor IF-2
MGQTSVLQFASELGLPAELLLEQLKSAGVNKVTSSDQLTEADKTLLLEYLRKEHGAQAPKNKITLTRKQNTEIKKTDSTGKARTIQVEVRKKRVLVRNEEAAAEQQPVVEPVIEEPIEEPILVAEPEVIAPAEELGSRY